MIIDEIKAIKSGKKELRQFGITFGVVSMLLGVLFLWRGKQHYQYFLIFSVLFISLALCAPQKLKIIQKFWMSFAVLMGWVMTRVILTILFYCVVSPTALLARLFDKLPLDLKLDKSRSTYWINKEHTKMDKSAYEKQF